MRRRGPGGGDGVVSVYFLVFAGSIFCMRGYAHVDGGEKSDT